MQQNDVTYCAPPVPAKTQRATLSVIYKENYRHEGCPADAHLCPKLFGVDAENNGDGQLNAGRAHELAGGFGTWESTQMNAQAV